MTPTYEFEIWKPIPEYPDYLVSDMGNVRTLKHGGNRLLTPTKNGRYLRVALLLEGKQKSYRVHRLVALTFIGEVPNGMEVRHLNGVSTDNRLENLRYGTRKENMEDQALHGTNYMASKTHCKSGHLFDESNIYAIKTAGGGVERHCRACTRIRGLIHRSKQKEKTREGGI